MTLRIALGPFEIHRKVGAGGMGEVWEGLHVPQQVPVAVKVLTHTGARAEAFARAFRNEVRAAAGLHHPGIVTVLDYGQMPAGSAKLSGGKFPVGSPYIVMEFARRGSLARFQEGVAWPELRSVLLDTLDALSHAHACGVIHRDLKPANILVGCGPEEQERIKLTDFGLAHALDHHEVPGKNDTGWGTPHFMAPEQFRGAWRDYGPWTDLYALGVMAFQLASGQFPFEAATITGLGRAHAFDAPATLDSRFEVPDELEGWIHRLLQKRPADRFQCAADAAWALRQFSASSAAAAPTTVRMFPVPDPSGRSSATTADPDAGTIGLGATDARDHTVLERPDTTLLIPDQLNVEGDGTQVAGFGSWEVASDDALEPARPLGLELVDVPPTPATWRRVSAHAPSPKLIGAGLGLFGLRTLPMVDRATERDSLWDSLRAVRESGEARAVLVRGPAGTGKSRLAKWLCERAHEVGTAKVLRANFGPITGPGDGLSRMIARHLRAGGMPHGETVSHVTRQLARWGVDDPVEIGAMVDFLLPVARDAGHRAMSIRTQGQLDRYGLLYRHLERLAARRTVLVWLDDVQWGADALAFVQFALEKQHRAPAPILFVMTARNEALVSRAVETELVAELAGNRRVRVLDVEPLEREHTEELVRELLFLNEKLADEVEERCAGNPLFAVQLVGDWVAGNKLRFGASGFELQPGASPDIPDDLHTLWRERLDLLLRSRAAEDIVALEIASALGTSVDLDEWYAACGQYGCEAPEELGRDLLECGLALSTDHGFDFCHGLLRESLERSAREAARWTSINAACARMLEGRYPGRRFPFAERYASHIVATDAPYLAVGALLDAAQDRIDRCDYSIAISILDRRDDLLEGLETAQALQERAQGWVARARVALWQGRLVDAQALASRTAVEARRSGWTSMLGRANLLEGLVELHRGDLVRAERLLERGEQSLVGTHERSEQGECILALGRVAQRRAEFAAANRHFERARELMFKAGYRLGEAQCLNALGDVARECSRFADARMHAEAAREVFEELHNTIGVADCTDDLAELSRLEGDFESAAELCVTALRMYEALGSEHSMHVRTNLALIRAAQGHDREAWQLLEQVRTRFEASGQRGPLATSTVLLLPILGRLSEFGLLEQRFDEAVPLFVRTGLKGRDVLQAALQATALLRDAGQDDLAEKIRAFAQQSLT